MKAFFNNLSIRNKLIFMGICLAFLVGILIFGIFPFQQKRFIINQFKEHSTALTHMTADNIRTAIEFGDTETAMTILGVLTSLEDFSFAVVNNSRGEEFVSLPVGKYLESASFYDGRAIFDQYCETFNNRVITGVPIYSGKDLLGSISIGFSLKNLDMKAASNFEAAILITLVLTFLIVLLSVLIADIISKPIQNLTETADAITNGNLNHRAIISSTDETGTLAKAFNEMAEKLSSTICNLSNSERTYRLHFENISDLIFVIDTGLKIISMSPSSEKLTGFPSDEFTGKHVEDLYMFTPESLKNLCRDVEMVSKGSGSLDSEYDITAVNGDRKIFETILTYIREDETILCVGRDVTEKRKALHELKDTKEFLESIIDNSTDGIIITDEEGYIIRTNRAFADLVADTKEEVLEKHLAEFSLGSYGSGTFLSKTGEFIKIDDNYLNVTRQNHEKLFENGRISNWETYLRAKDKRLVPVDISGLVLFDEHGEISNTVSLVREITDRKIAEKNLKDTKEFLSSVIESSQDIILITDSYGIILSLNSAFEKTTGFKRENFIGKHTSSLVIDDKGIREQIKNRTEELFSKGYSFYNAIWETKDRRRIEIECVSSMIKDETGRYTGGVSIIRDVTERKKMEEQIIQSEKLKSLGELAAGIAHDFNNNLAAILGRAQLLKRLLEKNRETSFSKQLLKGLKLIEKASVDGSETVRRIQEFSRRGKDESTFMVLDLNELVKDSLEFTRPLWKDHAEAKNITINVSQELALLPPVEGSASELREVFTNCIKNAVEALPEGGYITIKTFTHDGNVYVTITDTGSGIPETFRQKVFDPFYTTKGPQSSGLGMSMSYGIISRHKGTIGFESSEGKGTTFKIELPALTKSPFVQKKSSAKRTSPEREVEVLVIDDEEDVRDTLSDILSETGYTVMKAASGEEGLKIFRERKFDVVFTDLGMPDLSGYQIAEEIAKLDSKVPVVLVTGWQVASDEANLKKSGFYRLLYKPFQIDMVFSVMQECLENS